MVPRNEAEKPLRGTYCSLSTSIRRGARGWCEWIVVFTPGTFATCSSPPRQRKARSHHRSSSSPQPTSLRCDLAPCRVGSVPQQQHAVLPAHCSRRAVAQLGMGCGYGERSQPPPRHLEWPARTGLAPPPPFCSHCRPSTGSWKWQVGPGSRIYPHPPPCAAAPPRVRAAPERDPRRL